MAKRPDDLQDIDFGDNLSDTVRQRPIFFGSLVYGSAQQGKSFLIKLPQQALVNALIMALKFVSNNDINKSFL